MVVGFAAVLILNGGQSANGFFALRKALVVGVDVVQALFHCRGGGVQRVFCFLLTDDQQGGFIARAHCNDGVWESTARFFDEAPAWRFVHAEGVRVIRIEIPRDFFAIGRKFWFFGGNRSCCRWYWPSC